MYRGDKEVVLEGNELEKVKVEAVVAEHLRGPEGAGLQVQAEEGLPAPRRAPPGADEARGDRREDADPQAGGEGRGEAGSGGRGGGGEAGASPRRRPQEKPAAKKPAAKKPAAKKPAAKKPAAKKPARREEARGEAEEARARATAPSSAKKDS